MTINLIFFIKLFEYHSIIIFFDKIFSKHFNNTDYYHNLHSTLLPQSTS
nr:MAG TPA: hypothetical protein [Caudoviricetes sp.]